MTKPCILILKVPIDKTHSNWLSKKLILWLTKSEELIKKIGQYDEPF